jgi:hypothetical protein
MQMGSCHVNWKIYYVLFKEDKLTGQRTSWKRIYIVWYNPKELTRIGAARTSGFGHQRNFAWDGT